MQRAALGPRLGRGSACVAVLARRTSAVAATAVETGATRALVSTRRLAAAMVATSVMGAIVVVARRVALLVGAVAIAAAVWRVRGTGKEAHILERCAILAIARPFMLTRPASVLRAVAILARALLAAVVATLFAVPAATVFTARFLMAATAVTVARVAAVAALAAARTARTFAVVAARGCLVGHDRRVVAAILVRNLLTRQALDGTKLIALFGVA